MHFNSETNRLVLPTNALILAKYQSWIDTYGPDSLLSETKDFVVNDLFCLQFRKLHTDVNEDVDIFFPRDAYNPITYNRGLMSYTGFLNLLRPDFLPPDRFTWKELDRATAPDYNIHHAISLNWDEFDGLNKQIREITYQFESFYKDYALKMGKGSYGALSYFRQLVHQYWDVYFRLVHTLVICELFPRFDIMEVDAINRSLAKFRELGYFRYKFLGNATINSIIGRCPYTFWCDQDVSHANKANIYRVGQTILFGLACQVHSACSSMTAIRSTYDIQELGRAPPTAMDFVTAMFQREYGIRRFATATDVIQSDINSASDDDLEPID